MVVWVVVDDPGDQIAVAAFAIEPLGFVVARTPSAIADPEQRSRGVHRERWRLVERGGIVAEGAWPAVDQAGPRQGHGGPGQQQHPVATGGDALD
jgi:hypothetical protein